MRIQYKLRKLGGGGKEMLAGHMIKLERKHFCKRYQELIIFAYLFHILREQIIKKIQIIIFSL